MLGATLSTIGSVFAAVWVKFALFFALGVVLRWKPWRFLLTRWSQ